MVDPGTNLLILLLSLSLSLRYTSQPNCLFFLHLNLGNLGRFTPEKGERCSFREILPTSSSSCLKSSLTRWLLVTNLNFRYGTWYSVGNSRFYQLKRAHQPSPIPLFSARPFRKSSQLSPNISQNFLLFILCRSSLRQHRTRFVYLCVRMNWFSVFC